MDENNNVLTGDIAALRQFRDVVDRNINSTNQVENLKNEEKRLDKEINSNKKTLKDNIDSTVKSRRNAVASKYDSEIGKEEDRLKKIKDKRSKAKEKGVKERITEETAELTAQNKELKGNIRTALKGERLPRFCGSSFYFALFFTKGASEVFFCGLMMILMCFVLPGAVYYLLPVNKDNGFTSKVILAATYFVVIILVVFIYLLIAGKTKKKHEDGLKNIRQLRERIQGNNRQVRKITRAIRKDNNVEVYELGDFDARIKEVEDEIKRISDEKEKALLNFDENISNDIVKEIESKEMPRINDLQKEYDETVSQKESLEEIVKETSLKISSEYEAYIGKEYTNLERIDALIKIMENGQAQTVSQAIDLYKRQS